VTASETPSVETVTEFLEAILDLKGDLILCRGHARCEWVLEPRIQRLKPRFGNMDPDVETKMFNDFRRRCPLFLERDLSNRWELLAVAQHHGLPTRLLDWTLNPLAALWFAVRDPAGGESVPAAVWAFSPREDDLADTESTDPFQIARTKFFQPSHINRRLAAQSGWFSVHAWQKTQPPRFSRLELIAAYKDRLHKFEIPPTKFSSIRYDLDRLGINQATMYPDLTAWVPTSTGFTRCSMTRTTPAHLLGWPRLGPVRTKAHPAERHTPLVGSGRWAVGTRGLRFEQETISRSRASTCPAVAPHGSPGPTATPSSSSTGRYDDASAARRSRTSSCITSGAARAAIPTSSCGAVMSTRSTSRSHVASFPTMSSASSWPASKSSARRSLSQR
jgi:hypothetical protein